MNGMLHIKDKRPTVAKLKNRLHYYRSLPPYEHVFTRGERRVTARDVAEELAAELEAMADDTVFMCTSTGVPVAAFRQYRCAAFALRNYPERLPAWTKEVARFEERGEGEIVGYDADEPEAIARALRGARDAWLTENGVAAAFDGEQARAIRAAAEHLRGIARGQFNAWVHRDDGEVWRMTPDAARLLDGMLSVLIAADQETLRAARSVLRQAWGEAVGAAA